MSSLQQSTPITTISKEKPTFFRSSSFQKIKCSASYPFQFATAKWCKESIMTLFEALIIHSRIVLQRAFIVFGLPTFELISAAIEWLVCAVATYLGLTIKIQNESKTDCYCASMFKNELLSLRENFHRLINCKARQKNLIRKKQEAKHQTSTIETPKLPEQTKRERFLAEKISLLAQHETLLFKMEKKNHLIKENTKKKFLIKLFFYFVAAIAYIQFLLLFIALNYSRNPPGLFFLITCAGLIGYIVFKIFYMPESGKLVKKVKTKFISKKNCDDTIGEQPTMQKTITIIESVNKTFITPELTEINQSTTNYDEENNNRCRSRTRTTKYINFSNKTLSNIQLL